MKNITYSSSVFAGIVSFVFVIVVSLAAPPNKFSDQEPVIYLYIPRWENRTISPRLYFINLLGKLTETFNRVPEKGQYETTTFKPKIASDLDNGLGNRIDRNRIRSRPSVIPATDDSINPLKVRASISSQMVTSDTNRNTGDAIFISSHQANAYPVTGSGDNKITFTNAINPNNILQPKGHTIPTSQDQSDEQNTFFYALSQSKRKPAATPTPHDAIRTMDLALDVVKNSFWGDENIVFSPFSICNILALLMLGSDGKTFNELARQLNRKEPLQFSDTEKTTRFHTAFKQLLEYLNNKSGQQVSLEIVNKIFTDRKYPLINSFGDDAMTFYQAPVESFDFETQGEIFKKKINQWVRNKTHDKIKFILEDPPSPLTTMAFINAVYFKGGWETPFPDQFTRTKDFFVTPNEIVQVKLMTNQLTIPYVDNRNYQMIGIPYKDNKTGFFVMLPKASDGIKGLEEMERNLDTSSLMKSVHSMVPQKVAVKIPKMKLQTDGHMKEVLTSMGLPSIFDPQNANFSKISDSRGVFVSSIFHRAIVDVNEKGTEAAAATVATGDRTIDDVPIPFIANKPFIFFIYHIKADTVLFWGRVIRPQSSPE